METFAVTGVPLPAPVAAPTAAAEEVASEAKELLPEKPAEAEKLAVAVFIELESEVRLLPAEEPAPVIEVFLPE